VKGFTSKSLFTQTKLFSIFYCPIHNIKIKNAKINKRVLHYSQVIIANNLVVVIKSYIFALKKLLKQLMFSIQQFYICMKFVNVNILHFQLISSHN